MKTTLTYHCLALLLISLFTERIQARACIHVIYASNQFLILLGP